MVMAHREQAAAFDPDLDDLLLRRRRRIGWMAAVVGFILVTALGWLVVTELKQHVQAAVVEAAEREAVVNLKSIAAATQAYASKNGGALPDADHADLLLSYVVTPGVLRCPTLQHGIATTRPNYAQSLPRGHTDYIYCGPATRPTNSDYVVAYEKPSNHGGGAMFLFGDGRVEWQNGTWAYRMISDIESGINPPSQP